jgi:hypothetical protein
MMLIDAFLPEGITRLAVDSIFMMPQLGVLTEVQPRAATEVFNKDCLIHLGTCIAPAGEVKKEGPVLDYKIMLPDGKTEQGTLNFGQIKLIQLGLDDKDLPMKARAELNPHKNLDVGAGKGHRVEKEISGGVVGIILDGRGRPFTIPEDNTVRVTKLKEWMGELGVYPAEALDR